MQFCLVDLRVHCRKYSRLKNLQFSKTLVGIFTRALPQFYLQTLPHIYLEAYSQILPRILLRNWRFLKFAAIFATSFVASLQHALL
jgi:hypothetical protein